MQCHSLNLTEPQHQELLYYRDHDPCAYVRERAAALLKIASGLSPHAVARTSLLKPSDPDTIYGWLTRYQTCGFVGLSAHRHGGSKRRRL